MAMRRLFLALSLLFAISLHAQRPPEASPAVPPSIITQLPSRDAGLPPAPQPPIYKGLAYAIGGIQQPELRADLLNVVRQIDAASSEGNDSKAAAGLRNLAWTLSILANTVAPNTREEIMESLRIDAAAKGFSLAELRIIREEKASCSNAECWAANSGWCTRDENSYGCIGGTGTVPRPFP